jgi:hypothetical protein
MILRAGTFTLAAAGADYCNFVQYLVNWGLVQELGCRRVTLRQGIDQVKKTRGKPRVRPCLLKQPGAYQLALSVYLPLVAPVPPL